MTDTSKPQEMEQGKNHVRQGGVDNPTKPKPMTPSVATTSSSSSSMSSMPPLLDRMDGSTVSMEDSLQDDEEKVKTSTVRPTSTQDKEISRDKGALYEALLAEDEPTKRRVADYILREVELICAVCRDILAEPCVLLCQHVFCKTCLMQIKGDKKCPSCRTSFIMPWNSNQTMEALIGAKMGVREYTKMVKKRTRDLERKNQKQKMRAEIWKEVGQDISNVHSELGHALRVASQCANTRQRGGSRGRSQGGTRGGSQGTRNRFQSPPQQSQRQPSFFMSSPIPLPGNEPSGATSRPSQAQTSSGSRDLREFLIEMLRTASEDDSHGGGVDDPDDSHGGVIRASYRGGVGGVDEPDMD